MNSKPTSRTPATKGQSREDRLKSALKANLARRKSQTRARAGSGQAGSEQAESDTARDTAADDGTCHGKDRDKASTRDTDRDKG